MSTSERRRAAAMARSLRRGDVSFDQFADEFGDSFDELVEALYGLIEHEPFPGGVLGVTDKEYAEYQQRIESAIQELEHEP